MDSIESLTFSKLSAANRLRCEEIYHPLDDWSYFEWMNAVVGEVGELCHLFRDQERKHVISKQQLADELADIVIYLDLLAQHLRIDLGKAVCCKFNATSVRDGSDYQL